ncbi:MAG: hypothetical protein HY613_02770 [Candidatus Rokubacteria bacterium]|nr:hypothetical protein [Candidatus Rokubacteria bacterium]
MGLYPTLTVEAANRGVAVATRLEVGPATSEARYRVREQLVGNNFPDDAVGRTQNIQGTIVFDPEGKLTADSNSFKFGDFSLTRPQLFFILSVEDRIGLEVDFTLRQAS